MNTVDTAYLAFAFCALLLFWRLSARSAILLTVLGGWLILPVGTYPTLAPSDTFPWWITGLALPGEMLLGKVWVAPTVALIAAAVFDSARLRRFRPGIIDLPILLWCLWPLGAAALTTTPTPGAPIPAAPVAALYLAGSWGAAWFLGRIWFATPPDRLALIRGMAFAGLACLPFALLEGADLLHAHAWLYGPHPFQTDGQMRYLGFRPLGFFENGNQYGLWVSLCALAAVWLAVAQARAAHIALAAVVTGIALMAQSVGALALMLAGLCVLIIWRRAVTMPLVIICLVATALLAGLHLSGLVPLQWIARETPVGQALLDAFRALGRGSFLWRFSQDLKSLDIVQDAFLTGTGLWDWWRPAGTRPWGLWLLIIGQFGIVGFALSYGTLLVVAGRVLHRLRTARPWDANHAALPLALVVLLTLADALLNAFFFFPAFIAAGAIAGGGSHIKSAALQH